MNRSELIHLIQLRRSFLCVGLDPELGRMPVAFQGSTDGLFDFCAPIIDATRDLCVAYKPNTAFFEQYGHKGWMALEQVVNHIGSDHLIIADAKRGDIGNTSTMYARALYQGLGADAVTVAPYMGQDSVSPFLEFPGKWVVVLALTSNPGSKNFQLLRLETGEFLFEKVLREVSAWGTPDNTMFVVGATQPEFLQRVRAIVPDHFLLVPGVGAQGGSLDEVVRAGMIDDVGLLVNSSRQLLYASSGSDFAEKARKEAEKLRDQMSQLLDNRI